MKLSRLIVTIMGAVLFSVSIASLIMPLDNAAGGAHIDKTFGKMPLYFVENRGQLHQDVAFYVQGSDKTLYFIPNGVTFALVQGKGKGDSSVRPMPHEETDFMRGTEPEPMERRAVKLDFVGANPNVRPRGEDQQPAVISYFKGRPEDWKTGLPTYGKIVYEDLWPGIDLVYSGTVNKLKYEFVVKPGASPSQIHLAYRGATDVILKKTGELTVMTPLGDFEDAAPYAYQNIDGQRVDVPMAYALEMQAPDGNFEYGFDLGAYDPTKPLVLDPAVLVYCGYIGGTGEDSGHDIAVDNSGNVYVTGRTASSEASFPVVGGPDLTINGGPFDAFVAKVSADGTTLIYCGYIGGSSWDEGNGIAVDNSGNAYITGRTLSTEASFPVVIGPDVTHNGGDYDAFVAKVNAAGTALLYCGYIGGVDYDRGEEIGVDNSGNAYLTGSTASTQTTFPEVVGPDLTYNGGDWDAFVAKVSASGSSLSYCGYIGGSGSDWGSGITVDNSGNAYVTGETYSSQATFPEVVGPDLTHNGGSDAFVAKVNSSGSGLSYCGYIGGSSTDYGMGITVDNSGNAYVTGGAFSTQASFPVTGGPDLTHNGSLDVFVTKVNAVGTALLYCGYIGGTGVDYGSSIAVESDVHAFVTGYTTSTEASFPVLDGPDLTYNGGWNDAYVAMVNASGTGLSYCSYLGGTSFDGGSGIAVDNAGNGYLTGGTQSTEASFPVAIGPDTTYNGDYDVFVANIFGLGSDCCLNRGDANHDGGINVGDPTFLTDYLFFEGPAPPCFEEGDADGNGSINVADPTYLTDYLFFEGPAPPPCP